MKRGTPRHPKVADLCQRLNLELYEAVGILEMLWHFTAEYAPQGDIGKFDDRWIEASIGWKSVGRRRPGMLIQALIDTHWVDINLQSRLIVHDWGVHCDSIVKKHLSRLNLPFLSYQSVRDKLTDFRETLEALPYPSPSPIPSPSKLAERPPPDLRSFISDDWPETDSAITEFCPDSDNTIRQRIVEMAVRAFVEHNTRSGRALTDATLSAAVRTAYKPGKQYSAALFLTTVPVIIGNWVRDAQREAK